MARLNWVDVDLPLVYQFGFYSPNGERVRISGRTDVSYYSNIMPAGDSNSNLLTTFSTVYDSFYASTTDEFVITVTSFPSITTAGEYNGIRYGMLKRMFLWVVVG